jgi:hypothetical protein
METRAALSTWVTRAEAGEVCAAGVAGARIDDAGRANGGQPGGDSLRRGVDVARPARAKAPVGANIVKFAAKIGEKIDVQKRLFRLSVYFLQFPAAGIRHFEFLGAPLKRRVPDAAVGAIKTIPARAGVGERGIHNGRVRNSENEFAHVDAGNHARFAEPPAARRALEINQSAQAVRQARQSFFIALDTFCGDPAMRAVAAKFRGARKP